MRVRPFAVATGLFIGCVIAPLPAAAALWVSVGDSGTGTTVDVDSTSIRKSSGLRKAWVRYSYEKPRQGDVTTKFKPYGSSLMLTYFDCAERRSAVGSEAVYEGQNGAGDVLASMSDPKATQALRDVVPGSLGEAALEFVCAGKR